MKNTTATFLTARDPITGARGADILHFLRIKTIGDEYAVWMEAFYRVLADLAHLDAAKAKAV